MAKLPEAVEFVRTHQSALARVPFALFVMSMGVALGDTESVRKEVVKRLTTVRELVAPVSEGYFAGVLDLAKLPVMEKTIMGVATVFGLPRGNRRDWTTIRGWAEELPGKLLS